MTTNKIDKIVPLSAYKMGSGIAHTIWGKDYTYNHKTNEFRHCIEPEDKTELICDWFNL